MSKTTLGCQCGQVSLSVINQPILTVDCLCSDCQQAAAVLQQRQGCPQIIDQYHATRFVMYRKDKVEFNSGIDQLKQHQLNPAATTRRVIASCCNTPMFLEFTKGHWLSIYGLLWPKQQLPQLELRTMTRSRPAGIELPNDVANPKTHNAYFFFKLLTAWAAMKFKAPKIDFITAKIE